MTTPARRTHLEALLPRIVGDLAFFIDRANELEQAICEDDAAEFAFRELGHFTPAKERAAALLKELKELQR